jgi:hypothetical protein
MKNLLIEQAQYLVETDEMEPLEYLHILNEINSLSEEELIQLVENDLIEALAEGEITEEEFDLMVDEYANIDNENYAQDVGTDSGMQENDLENGEKPDEGRKQKEEVRDDIDEDLEVDEGVPGMIETSGRGRHERRYVDVYPNDGYGYGGGYSNGMQEELEEDYNEQDLGAEDRKGMSEDLEVDEGMIGNVARTLVKQSGFHNIVDNTNLDESLAKQSKSVLNKYFKLSGRAKEAKKLRAEREARRKINNS